MQPFGKAADADGVVPRRREGFADDQRAAFHGGQRVDKAGIGLRGNHGDDGGGENGGKLGAHEAGNQKPQRSAGGHHQERADGESGKRAFERHAEQVNNHQHHGGEIDHADGDIGKLFADQILRYGGGRCVEIGDGTDFAFAHHADRRHHGGYHHQHQHHHARSDGVNTVEILIVHKARFDAGGGFERNGQPAFGDAVFGVGGDQAADVAADIGGVERHGAVHIKTDFGFESARQIAPETARNIDDQYGAGAFEHGVDFGFGLYRRLLEEVARTVEIFDQLAAGGGLVAVVNGEFQIPHVKRNPPRYRRHDNQRAEHGEKQADFVAQEFFSFAAGEGPNHGEAVFEGLGVWVVS